MFRRRRQIYGGDSFGRSRRFWHRFSLQSIGKTKITIGLLIVFGLLVGYSIFFSGLFQLKVISYVPAQINCVEKRQITDLLPRNKNLLFIKAEEIANSIKAKYPCLAEVKVEKKFPETLTIFTSERQIAALIRAGIKIAEEEPVITEVVEASASSESAKPTPKPKDEFKVEEQEYPTLYSVDRNGFILAKDPYVTEDLPLFYYLSEQELLVNHWLTEGSIERALEIHQKAEELGLDVITYKVEGSGLFLDGPQRIVFLLEKDVTAQVIPLQLILQKAKMDSAVIEKIDLRFDKPVVTYGKKR